MEIETFCHNLPELLAGVPVPSRIETAAHEIADFFRVTPHEIAFFRIDDGRTATFLWPPPKSGAMTSVPLKAFATSLMSATAREARAFLDNAFCHTPHLHMFEHMLADSQQRIPVQKIMSVPVVDHGTLIGVLQVSHKGLTAEAAGTDFSEQNLEQLSAIASAIAPFCPRTTPLP